MPHVASNVFDEAERNGGSVSILRQFIFLDCCMGIIDRLANKNRVSGSKGTCIVDSARDSSIILALEHYSREGIMI